MDDIGDKVKTAAVKMGEKEAAKTEGTNQDGKKEDDGVNEITIE